MNATDDQLLALVSFLGAVLITVAVLFSLIWLADLQAARQQPVDMRTCNTVVVPGHTGRH